MFILKAVGTAFLLAVTAASLYGQSINNETWSFFISVDSRLEGRHVAAE